MHDPNAPKMTEADLAKKIDDAMAAGKKSGAEIAASLAADGVTAYAGGSDESQEGEETEPEKLGETEEPGEEMPPMPPRFGGPLPPPEERRKAPREKARDFAVMVALGGAKKPKPGEKKAEEAAP